VIDEPATSPFDWGTPITPTLPATKSGRIARAPRQSAAVIDKGCELKDLIMSEYTVK
jgi:hypothetical protein